MSTSKKPRTKRLSKKPRGEREKPSRAQLLRGLGLLVPQLRRYEGELLAYRMMIAELKVHLKRVYPETSLNLDKMLERHQNDRESRRKLHQKYDLTLENLLQKLDQEMLDQGILLWLEEWKPTGLEH